MVIVVVTVVAIRVQLLEQEGSPRQRVEECVDPPRAREETTCDEVERRREVAV